MSEYVWPNLEIELQISIVTMDNQFWALFADRIIFAVRFDKLCSNDFSLFNDKKTRTCFIDAENYSVPRDAGKSISNTLYRIQKL